MTGRASIPFSALPDDLRAELRKRASTGNQQVAKGRALKVLRAAQVEAKREQFYAMLKRAKLPRPEAEVCFDPERRWQFDYAWREQRVALEVEGGVWTGGRHTRGAGFLKDIEKYNAATLQGWRVLRTTPDGLTGRVTEQLLRKALKENA